MYCTFGLLRDSFSLSLFPCTSPLSSYTFSRLPSLSFPFSPPFFLFLACLPTCPSLSLSLYSFLYFSSFFFLSFCLFLPPALYPLSLPLSFRDTRREIMKVMMMFMSIAIDDDDCNNDEDGGDDGDDCNNVEDSDDDDNDDGED